MVTVIFPSLVVRTLGGLTDPSGINSFEVGLWGPVVIIVDIAIFGVAIFYFKNKLPQTIAKSFRLIFSFEISQRLAFLSLLILIGLYVVFTVPEILTPEPWPDYYNRVEPVITRWSITDSEGIDQLVTLFFLSTSLNVFGYGKLIPFVASIAVLIITYLLAHEITKKRLAGILSTLIVLQSGTFLIYDTTATYPNFWVLFYLVSLYLCYKKWIASPILFILSILSKQNAALFLPMTMFFVYESSLPKPIKIRLIASYVAIIVLGAIAIFFGTKISFWGDSAEYLGFQWHDFWMAFNAVSYQLRFDILIIVLLTPLVIGLYIATRKKIMHANSILFLIFGALISQPLMAATTIVSSEPYRFMPLIVFFALGIGVLFSKNIRQA
jgi:hypothetical protein